MAIWVHSFCVRDSEYKYTQCSRSTQGSYYTSICVLQTCPPFVNMSRFAVQGIPLFAWFFFSSGDCNQTQPTEGGREKPSGGRAERLENKHLFVYLCFTCLFIYLLPLKLFGVFYIGYQLKRTRLYKANQDPSCLTNFLNLKPQSCKIIGYIRTNNLTERIHVANRIIPISRKTWGSIYSSLSCIMVHVLSHQMKGDIFILQ